MCHTTHSSKTAVDGSNQRKHQDYEANETKLEETRGYSINNNNLKLTIAVS